MALVQVTLIIDQTIDTIVTSSSPLAVSRPTIWVPDGVLDHLLARETALARPNMPLLDHFFAPSFP